MLSSVQVSDLKGLFIIVSKTSLTADLVIKGLLCKVTFFPKPEKFRLRA